MKERITYILPPGTDLGASDLDIKPDSLTFAKGGLAVEEWRFTLGLDELPHEVCLGRVLTCIGVRAKAVTAASNDFGGLPRASRTLDVGAEREVLATAREQDSAGAACLLHAAE